ncbi:MAG: hypothetical protein H6564_21280 [Lewinellaceae bacterium]|nr:hypothetical protein [Lewinellaceae bacterium]
MSKNPGPPLFTTPASLWDGASQLPGSLELWETEAVFRPTGFASGHLSLRIPLAGIEKVEEYLVFNLARNGLRIQSREGKYDLFVLEDMQGFKARLLEMLAR